MPKKASKKSVVEQLDELDNDDLELIEDDDETPAKPTKRNKEKTSAPAPKAESTNTGMGASWLAEFVNEELGTEYTAAQMRVVLRKMAKDGDLEREVGTDRARYQFTGERDPIVRQVLKRIKSGEVVAARKERLDAARSGESPAKRKPKDVADETEVVEKSVKRKKAKTDDNADETPVAKKSAARRSRRKSDEEDD